MNGKILEIVKIKNILIMIIEKIENMIEIKKEIKDGIEIMTEKEIMRKKKKGIKTGRGIENGIKIKIRKEEIGKKKGKGIGKDFRMIEIGEIMIIGIMKEIIIIIIIMKEGKILGIIVIIDKKMIEIKKKKILMINEILYFDLMAIFNK